nr:ankyrin repeat domain-containing protein 16-like [Crassostrea gigas]
MPQSMQARSIGGGGGVEGMQETAKCGHAALVEHLLLSGADVEKSNLDGKRPLHEAAQASQLECVQILLQFGAQVDSLKRADWTPLMLACTKDSIEDIQQLLKSGANVLLNNKDGWTPFHIACREGHLDIVRLLYDHNNTVMNTANKNGRIPLHTAALHGCHSVVTFLLNVGPYTVDTTDSSGSTPLMDVIKSDHVEVAQTLISTQKGDLCREDNAGLGPLHLAAQGGCLKSVKRWKALHIAADGQHSETCKYLLENGAVIRADNSGLTPGMLARKPDVCSLFQEV